MMIKQAMVSTGCAKIVQKFLSAKCFGGKVEGSADWKCKDYTKWRKT